MPTSGAADFNVYSSQESFAGSSDKREQIICALS